MPYWNLSIELSEEGNVVVLLFSSFQNVSPSPRVKVNMLVAQLCPTLYDPWTETQQVPLSMKFPLLRRILEWGDIPFSRGSSPNLETEPESPTLQADLTILTI